MISYDEFEKIVVNILERDISSNKDQKSAISSDLNQSLFIVAGPGSGKTTVIVLKILKSIFVDDVEPEEIIATTFTRKAADELDSRILDWGYKIKDYLLENLLDYDVNHKDLHKVAHIDFNQIMTGTIDSVAQDLIKLNREPGTNIPNVIENFIAESAMRNCLLQDNKYENKDLQEYLGDFSGKGPIKNPSIISKDLLTIKNKMYYDFVDFNEIKKIQDPGTKAAIDIIEEFEEELKSRNSLDFPMLESYFLDNIIKGKYDESLKTIKLILVDEYQDTNLLQEKIYFNIGKYAIKNNGGIIVVGDDDQSLYRFRGATVDLFTNFKNRAQKKLNTNIEEVNLKDNYRSTEKIIDLCNHFAELDSEYQNARVSHKPPIVCPENNKGKDIPIIGLFRSSQDILARDLSNLIAELINKGHVERKIKSIVNSNSFKLLNKEDEKGTFKNKSKRINKNNAKKEDKLVIDLDKNNGSAADIAFLTYSTKESTMSHRHKFTYYLRRTLQHRGVNVFNPRGKDIQDIEYVAIFCGLMLECIDPDMVVQKKDKEIPKGANRVMKKWREEAKRFIDKNPEPHEPLTLNDFVEKWQVRIPYGMDNWPKEARLMDLAYKLISWIDVLQDDIEGVVFLEAITKTITQTGFFNKYASTIYFDSPENEYNSIDELYWNVFIPIATGGVSIEEELLDTLPDDRLNIMTIHQSKGLEFPLVIVDVGSEFKKDLASTSPQRFPKKGGEDQELEDRLRKYSEEMDFIERDQVDRSFDDLIRRYFVAFSRAQDVLILIGLNSNIYGYDTKTKHKSIPNVALGWNRDEEFIGFDEIYMI